MAAFLCSVQSFKGTCKLGHNITSKIISELMKLSGKGGLTNILFNSTKHSHPLPNYCVANRFYISENRDPICIK